MKPLIIISSQSLACGCLIAEAVMRSQAEKETPHLIIADSKPPGIDQFLQATQWVKINLAPMVDDIDPRLLRKTPHRERSHPNQPWYAKVSNRRRK
jgi:hypothetical protein